LPVFFFFQDPSHNQLTRKQRIADPSTAKPNKYPKRSFKKPTKKRKLDKPPFVLTARKDQVLGFFIIQPPV